MKKVRLLSLLAILLPLSVASCNLDFSNYFKPVPGGGGGGGTPGGGGENIPEIVPPEDIEDTFVNPNQNPDTKPTSGTLSVNIVAVNDFHGAIEASGNNIGLAAMGTYFRKQAETPNTLILDQGDTWQGSIYSNYNHGQLINDVYSYAHVSARTVGNHDFDWGVEAIKHNTARTFAGYNIPVLGGNVYDYNFSTKVEGTTQQTDIGKSTVTYTLKNGLKVGVVGVIGRDQITSINSLFTHDICFKSHVPIIKQEATNLRNAGCDIVILSIHADEDDVRGNGLEDYVDLALCAHSHQAETSQEGNLTYAQFGSYGTQLGNITLTYDCSSNQVTNTTVNTLYKSQVNTAINNTIDTNISNLVSHYNNQCTAAASEVVASNVSGSFGANYELPNLMCKAVYDQTVMENYNVVLSYCNQARTSFNSKTRLTYEDLYQAFPFDNIIYIIEVTGADILTEVKNYSNVYYNPTFNKQIVRTQKYRIACLDYLAFHTNTSRNYDYFRSFDGVGVGYLSANYRVILRNWLIRNNYNKGTALDASDFNSSLDAFNRSLLTESFA